MTTLTAQIHIAEDGSLTGHVPAGAATGSHVATIVISDSVPQGKKRFRVADLPRHEGPWDNSVSLSRQDLYGDDGR